MNLAQNNIFGLSKQIPTVDIVRHYLPGLELRQRGNRWVARCPFHEERTPSFVLFPDGGIKCFGCGWYGDVINLVSKALEVRPIEAARIICRDFGIPAQGNKPDPEYQRKAREIKKTRQLEKAFKRWVEDTYLGLCTVYRALGHLLAREGYWRYPALAQLEPYLEHLLNILQYGPLEAQIQLYKSRQLEGWQKR